MAPAMKSFLESQDWQQKTVIPFMTHGGWPGHVIKDMKQDCSGADFGPSMEIQFDSNGGSDMVTKASAVDHWIQQVKTEVTHHVR